MTDTGEWKPVNTLPPPGERPGWVWVVVEGSQFHSGLNWYRQKAGLARTHNEGFEADDIRMIEKLDHMDRGTGIVTHWLPIKLPPYPNTRAALQSPPLKEKDRANEKEKTG